MAGEVVFVVNPLGWAHAFNTWNVGPVGTWMAAKTLETELLARTEAPGPGKPPNNRTGWNYSTGELQAGIVSRQERATTGKDLEGHVIATADHALMVHEGTLPHLITPNKGKVLKFRSRQGKMIYARVVKHPGTRRNDFLVRALEQALRTTR